MRSRDGNHSFTQSISTLILFVLCSSALFADEYLISYQYTVKDSILYNEKLFISKSMTKCSGKLYKNSLLLERNGLNSFKKILQNNKILFFQYLSKIGLNVQNYETLYNQTDHSFIIITLKTTCFKVDFNENFVKIAPLK